MAVHIQSFLEKFYSHPFGKDLINNSMEKFVVKMTKSSKMFGPICLATSSEYRDIFLHMEDRLITTV